MKKTFFVALVAIAMASMSQVQASPVPSVASHEIVCASESFNLQSETFVITNPYSTDDLIMVEQLQFVDFYSEPVVSNQKALKAFKVANFNGNVFKPPLCIRSLQLLQTQSPFKIYTGNRCCFIRNPSKLIS